MQTPAVKSAEIEKNGRFWAVNVGDQILAIVLYKRGAIAIQELVCSLAGVALPEIHRIYQRLRVDDLGGCLNALDF